MLKIESRAFLLIFSVYVPTLNIFRFLVSWFTAGGFDSRLSVCITVTVIILFRGSLVANSAEIRNLMCRVIVHLFCSQRYCPTVPYSCVASSITPTAHSQCLDTSSIAITKSKPIIINALPSAFRLISHTFSKSVHK